MQSNAYLILKYNRNNPRYFVEYIYIRYDIPFHEKSNFPIVYFLSTQHENKLPPSLSSTSTCAGVVSSTRLPLSALRAPIFVARKLAAPTHRVNYKFSNDATCGIIGSYWFNQSVIRIFRLYRKSTGGKESTRQIRGTNTRLTKRIPLNMHWMEKRFETMFPSLASALFLIFVTRGRNGLNSPRRILSLSLSRYRETEVVRGEKGESFSREQRTSHMVGWRAGAIIVLACNVRSVGGQEPVSFFVSERACLVETSVRRVMSMTLLRCSCCTHKSSPGTTRASHRYIRACTTELPPSTGHRLDNLV